MSSRSEKMRDDKVLAERNELKEEVARKNKEIEKLKAALVSAQEHLSKAIECLQEPTTTTTTTTPTPPANGNKTGSPLTPKNTRGKFGSGGILKRNATFVDGHDSPESHRSLKRSSRSAPEKNSKDF